jgi:hypothetical protein
MQDFARQACKSPSSLSIQMNEVGKLIDSLRIAIQEAYPGLDSSEAFSHANAGISLACPLCGELSHDSVSLLYLAGSDMFHNVVYGGPNTAALSQGHCPRCGGSRVVAKFDPSGVKARSAALFPAADEIVKAPPLKPAFSCPYLGSFTLSSTGETAAWVSGGKDGDYEITIASTVSGATITSLRYPARKYPPKCNFVGDNRILISGCLADDSKASNLALYDAASGKRICVIDISDCYFSYVAVRHDTRTIAAEKDTFNLVIVEAAGDKLSYRTVETSQIYQPGPRFGPDGNIYLIVHYQLYRIESDRKIDIMRGSNCICFDPAGRVYCGGGYSDRSGDSAIHIADLSSNTAVEIPWGREPVDSIALAGNYRVLVANEVSTVHAGRYPNAVVTLVSLDDRKKHWSITIGDLKPGRDPILLSVPEEQWALLQTGRLLKRISLADGSLIQTASKQIEEYITAEWLASQRHLCLTRRPGGEGAGTVEFYRIEPA